MTNTTLEKWEEKTLGEILDKGSYNLSANKLNDCVGIYPVYGASGLIAKVNFYQQDKEYLAIIKDGAGVGRVYHYQPKTSVLGTLQYLYPKPNTNIRFAYYYLQSIDFAKYYQGAAIPHIYYRDYKSEKLVLPPLSEQERIVAKLDKAFEAIAKVKANAEQNLNNAKKLLESALNNAFTENTEGWEEKTLGSISDLKQNKAEVKNIDANTLVSFVPMEYLGINQKYFNSNQSKPIKNLIENYTYFAENDVIMAKITPCFENGKIGIARGLTNKIGFGSSEYIVFRTNKDINREYLYYFLNRGTFRKEGAQNMLGAVGHKRVSKEFIENYPFSYPSLPEQQKIVEKLDALQQQTKQLEQIYIQKIKECDELKQSILQKAFRGEL